MLRKSKEELRKLLREVPGANLRDMSENSLKEIPERTSAKKIAKIEGRLSRKTIKRNF